jgi:hypothetical protein
MYFPYLRCKQFELLALREIASTLNRQQIRPILEPVKKSMDNLERGLASLITNRINFTLILNPIYGDFAENSAELVSFVNNKLGMYLEFQFGILLYPSIDLDSVTSQLHLLSFERPISLIHLSRLNNIEALADWCRDKEIRLNFYGENFPARRYRGIITPETKVLLDDKFKPQPKNADYINVPDEFFSDDHLYYQDDGFIGFSDYVTIGNDFTDTGFLPFAVAIHLTYEKDPGELWIRHFVSDSNSDSTDPAGKFGEALEKLVAFIDEKNIQTQAANEFRELYANEHYPGLGSIKKLSIKHHLELINDILSR